MLGTIERLAQSWKKNSRRPVNAGSRMTRSRRRTLRLEPLEGRELLSQVVYSQTPDPNGAIIKSAWYPPDGLDGDAYAYDNFTLSSTQTITQLQWQGGYTNFLSGAGKAPVFDFTISIYDSIAAGIQPNVINPPLAQYQVGGNAGETAAGTAGGVPVYKYSYTLSTPFVAHAGTKYWVQIEASQGVTPNYYWPPDWGLQTATGGDGSHFYSITGGSLAGGTLYASGSGDLAFSLLTAGGAKTVTPTVNVNAGTYTFDGKAHLATATVTGPKGNPVKGTVSFFYSQNGVVATPTNAGTYDVLATFTSKDPKFGGATGTGTITINRAHTAVKVTSAQSGSVAFGKPATFTAKVTSTDSTVVPDGYAVFLNQGSYIGYGALVNGVATFTTSSLPVGTDHITAAYSGSNYFTGTSTAVTQVVTPDRTTSTLTVSPKGTVPAGQAVTFTVTVTNKDAGYFPTGTVIFMDGSTVLGKVTLGSYGKASFTTSLLSHGTHPKITVQYAGSTNYLKSASAALSLTIA